MFIGESEPFIDVHTVKDGKVEQIGSIGLMYHDVYLTAPGGMCNFVIEFYGTEMVGDNESGYYDPEDFEWMHVTNECHEFYLTNDGEMVTVHKISKKYESTDPATEAYYISNTEYLAEVADRYGPNLSTLYGVYSTRGVPQPVQWLDLRIGAVFPEERTDTAS